MLIGYKSIRENLKTMNILNSEDAEIFKLILAEKTSYLKLHTDSVLFSSKCNFYIPSARNCFECLLFTKIIFQCLMSMFQCFLHQMQVLTFIFKQISFSLF